MQLQEPLTKENFWNEMMEQFPIATKEFCEWVDEYKKSVGWEKLFNAGHPKEVQHEMGIKELIAIQIRTKSPKFHELPHAMQQGIFLEFIRQVLPTYFEQVERHMSELYDFEEDVKSVFFSMEETAQH